MIFDPNKQGGEWATFIPRRSPAFKVHATQGHATAACKVRSSCTGKALHERAIADYVELYTKDTTGKWIEVPINRVFDKHTKSIIK